jgi:hypothetical protein
MTRLPTYVLLASVASACGGTPAIHTRRSDTIVRFAGEPAETSIWVDGRFVTLLRYARGGVAMAPGRHQIELRADKFMTQFVEVELGAGKQIEFPFELRPILP